MTTIVVRPELLINLSKSFIQYAEEVQKLEQQLERNYQSIPWSVKAKSFVDQQWYEAKRQMNESMHYAHNLASSLERAAEKFAKADQQEVASTVPIGAKQKETKKEEQGFFDKMMGSAKKLVDKATHKVEELVDEAGNLANKFVDYVKDPDGLLSDVSTYCGYISAAAGTAAILTVWCPPVAGVLGTVSTIAGAGGLIADTALYSMGKKDGMAIALDAVGTIPGLKGFGTTFKSVMGYTKAEWSLSHWVNRGTSDGEAIQMAKDILMGKATSTVGWIGAFRDSTPK
ncbi:WXG100 family type VII secretion target [Bacillus cytotoxicus]|uniref:WXG100 family type VII secretion target n=1 Tax=Bacillus cereus group sp. BfR-BA-01492 TaxID=2920361 RepID=UPI001F58122C|nr:WXG100 family type VII secretion target [Bacillus cereus group sp. BfR-BA-01492]EMA6344314.1 WXG100 family type VII secretion target [Bacillus cytotoxicus]EMA6345351.1 WXG100 family type VII secretion target [Bacillus cytotoxicus]